MTFAKNSLSQDDVANIKRESLPVIIFGAGIVGEVLFRACCKAGIEVECFCDNNINKTKTTLCGVNIVPVRDLRAKYPDAHFIISAADIKDVVDQLHDLRYSKCHASSFLLRDFDTSHYQFSAAADFVEFAVSTCRLCHDSYLSPDKLFMRSADIIITERCSLKCKDCSNLMQYYINPKDCDIDEIIQSIEAFCALIDEVNEFRIIGGEPFMNKEIHLVVERLINESKVRKIVIYTNGTILPNKDQIKYFKNDKVLFIVTDYGKLSRNIDTLTHVLQQQNIAYFRLKVEGWSDCAKIMRHGRTREQQQKLFTDCCAKNLATLSNGKLYRCPFAANAARLMAVPDYKEDYINIIRWPQDVSDIFEMKKRIGAFLSEKTSFDTCDYCNGRSLETPAEMPPALQTSNPLKYELCR